MANAEKTENKSKVLVNVYEPLIAIMKHKFDAACLKRDAYLDKALRIEAGFLRDEVKEPNSDRARNFIAKNLKELKLKPLSLSLSTETAELINEVCKEKNIPRDSFINRFFLLLIASDNVLMALFGNIDNDFLGMLYGGTLGLFDFSRLPNVLDGIEECTEIAPLFNLREVLTGSYMIDLYEYQFKKHYLSMLPNDYSFLKTDNIIGFNTFMTDDDVSEQEEMNKTINSKVELDKLLAFAKREKQARPVKTKPAGEAQ